MYCERYARNFCKSDTGTAGYRRVPHSTAVHAAGHVVLPRAPCCPGYHVSRGMLYATLHVARRGQRATPSVLPTCVFDECSCLRSENTPTTNGVPSSACVRRCVRVCGACTCTCVCARSDAPLCCPSPSAARVPADPTAMRGLRARSLRPPHAGHASVAGCASAGLRRHRTRLPGPSQPPWRGIAT